MTFIVKTKTFNYGRYTISREQVFDSCEGYSWRVVATDPETETSRVLIKGRKNAPSPAEISRHCELYL